MAARLKQLRGGAKGERREGRLHATVSANQGAQLPQLALSLLLQSRGFPFDKHSCGPVCGSACGTVSDTAAGASGAWNHLLATQSKPSTETKAHSRQLIKDNNKGEHHFY